MNNKIEQFDLVVVGSGPAGISGAVQAAKMGKSVAIIEKTPDKIGGAWINTGTLPSKTMREVLESITSIRAHVKEKWVPRIMNNLSYEKLKKRSSSVSQVEEDLVRTHIKNNDIKLIQGFGLLESTNELRIIPTSSKEPYLIEFDKLLIATGSKPRRPENIPFDGWRVIDSDDVLRLESTPKSIAIYGAGVIGCEYACIFGSMGVKTTIIDARSYIMQSLDREIAEELKNSMEDLGVEFKMNKELTHLESIGPITKSTYKDGESIEAEVYFFAAGRTSNTEKMGLDKIGIDMNDRGAIKINDYFQTNIPNIYAAGDAVGPPALASTSTLQGRIAVKHALGVNTKPFPKFFPVGVYTIPELSSVGLTEEEVKKMGIEYVVGRAPYEEITRGHIRGDTHGLLKIVASAKDKNILGVHIVGADAANLIHIGQCFMLSNLTLEEMTNEIVFNYPTLAEGYKIAAFNAFNKIGKPISHNKKTSVKTKIKKVS